MLVVVDCVISEWSNWGDCSVTCGDGLHTSERHIVAEAEYGGQDCPDMLTRQKQCSVESCEGILSYIITYCC